VAPLSRRANTRGFALVIVVWSIGLLALLGTQLTTTSRVGLRLAMQRRDLAQAEAAADGAVREAMFLLLGGKAMGAAAPPVLLRIGDAQVRIVVEDEAIRINPNAAPRDVLRGLLASLGVDPPRAALLAAEIADWRSRSQTSVLGGMKIDRYREYGLPYRWGGRGFESVDEMSLLPDITPEILARVRPWLSVYHEGDVADPTRASSAGAAIRDAKLSSQATEPILSTQNVIARVTAVANLAGRAKFERSAVLRLRANAPPDAVGMRRVIQVLTWN
jgi:general secretion pathway protein K